MTLWETGTLLMKGGSYLSLAALCGGLLASGWFATRATERWIRGYTLVGAVGTALLVSLHFLVQVGALAENGLRGMVDPMLASLLWESGVGSTFAWRELAALMALLLLCIRTLSVVGQRLLMLVSFLAVAVSFSQSGHSAEQGLWVQLALGTHALIALLWIGMLLPLWLQLRREQDELAKQLLTRFGKLATVLVPVLLLAGAWVGWRLAAGNLPALWRTAYGEGLALKLVLVVGLLLLALLNRNLLVPRLPSTRGLLLRSIRAEKALVLAIIVVTLVISTLMGPEVSE
ncbi:CopD family protein [Pokkaliibacter sp. CJK22405]|uniref:CopD family protein n=1 Tax=Pokkaliibacter sp. CJK22405 TaxID=3384615 RepID=UPI0039847E75